MTTKKQILSLLRPLVERHDDLVLVDKDVILKPVRHVVRFLFLDRTGEAVRFRARWGACHLCEMRSRLFLNWSPRIQPARNWRWDNPNLESDFFAAVETDALPKMRAIETLEDLIAHASQRDQGFPAPPDRYPTISIGIDIALGRLDKARAACAELTGTPNIWWRPEHKEKFERVGHILCRLLAADDRVAMARLLHDWEAYTVAKLKIDHLWEPTPFPLELQAGLGDEAQRGK